MIEKYHGGVIHKTACSDPLDDELIALVNETVAKYQDAMDHMEINTAIKALWALISRANKYIDETGPWLLAKDPAKAARLETVMYNLAEVLRIVAILTSPYIPSTSPKIYTQLGLTAPEQFLLADTAWGGLLTAPKCRRMSRCIRVSRSLKAEKLLSPLPKRLLRPLNKQLRPK